MQTDLEKKIKKKEGFQGQNMIVIPRTVLNANRNQNPLVASLYITDIGYYPNAKFHHRKRLRGADQHIMLYCVKGKGVVIIKKETYYIEPGHFIIIPRRLQHEYTADATDPWTIYWVHFTGTNADNIVDYIESIFSSHMGFIHHDQSRVDLFESIYNQLERGYGIEDMVYANMCFYHYLATFTRRPGTTAEYTSAESDVVNQVIDFMKKNIDAKYSLRQMANEVNTSASHLSFLFKKKTGYPPMEYFNHLKVQQACQYLLFTDMRVKAIASLLGIDDPYYFSRFFKKLMGVSPNVYRERKN